MNNKFQSKVRAKAIYKELAKLKAEECALKEKKTVVRLVGITNDGHAYGMVGEHYKPLDKNVIKIVTRYENGIMFTMIDGEEKVIDLDLYNELIEKLRPASETSHLNKLIDFCNRHDVYLAKGHDTIEDIEKDIRNMPFLSSKKFDIEDLNLLKKIDHPWVLERNT